MVYSSLYSNIGYSNEIDEQYFIYLFNFVEDPLKNSL